MSISADGKLNLSLPPGTNPAIAAAVDTANQIIQNGPDVVWSLRKLVDVANGVLGGPVISLPNTGGLGALDLGVTDGGEFRLGVKPPGADDTHITWFDLNIESRIEFQAQDGKLNDGFDPPLEEWQDEGQRNIWHTSVAKVSPNNVNMVVKIVFPSAHVAQQYQLVVPTASQPHVDVSPKTFTASQTDLTITGMNGSSARFEAEIHLRKKGQTAVYGKLVVDVMPWQTLSVKAYKLEPNIALNRGKVTLPLPSLASLEAELNARFKQACVSFNFTSATVLEDEFEYDTDPQDGYLQTVRVTYTGSGLNISTSEVSAVGGQASAFTGSVNIAFVGQLAETTTDQQNVDTTSTSTLGINLNVTGLANTAFISANRWNTPFSYSNSENADGASFAIQRVIAHEVGHVLNLSKRAFFSGTLYVPAFEKHDNDPSPEGTAALLRPGPVGPVGRWMRFEDWREANDHAGVLAQ